MEKLSSFNNKEKKNPQQTYLHNLCLVAENMNMGLA